MKTVTWAQIIIKWTDEDGEYHEAYFENVNQLANTLRAFKDLGCDMLRVVNRASR